MSATNMVFLVLRITHTWHGPLSIHFIREMTGLERQQIVDALGFLQQEGLVKKTWIERYTLTEKAKQTYTWI